MSSLLPVAPIILWLSKGKVVVQQSYANLSPGGKYNHLLGSVIIKPLSEYDPEEVEHTNVPVVLFATVGTFNQRDMEAGSLTIYRSEVDTTEQSTWDALADASMHKETAVR
jgi:type III restriction enzyme